MVSAVKVELPPSTSPTQVASAGLISPGLFGAVTELIEMDWLVSDATKAGQYQFLVCFLSGERKAAITKHRSCTEAGMSGSFGRGLHAAPGRAVSSSAYDRYLGRWSRLTVPDLLAAADIAQGHHVLDVATGTGEAALMAIPIVGDTGFVVGADISLEMIKSARGRLDAPLFWPINADGQALPFKDGAFDAVICQLGLQFFPNPAAGLSEFRRVVRAGGSVAVCVNATSDKLPMWGNLADAMERFLTQSQRDVLALSWCLADARKLEGLFGEAGFQDIRVEQIRREGTIDGFDDYWAPIEEGVGQIPQTYSALEEADRRLVRDYVNARLAQYESADGKLTMGVEMLIGSGRA